MRTFLAALDSSAAALAVLGTALGIAQLTDATVEAVHVHNDSTEIPEALAARAGIALRILDGPVEQRRDKEVPSLLRPRRASPPPESPLAGIDY